MFKTFRRVPTEPNRRQTFVGLNICVTNIAPDVRKEIAARTVEHGGHFSGSLTRDCTHLIAKSPEGDKYKVAKFWTSVKLVNEQWFWQSIEAEACLEESLFPVCATGISQPIQLRETEPIPETAAITPLLSSPFVQSVAAQLKPKQNPVESQLEAPSFVPSTETKLQGAPRLDLQMEGEVDHYNGDGLYLSSCRVHLSGFTTAEEKRLLSMLFDGGATRFIEFNDTVTHIILGQPAESELKEIRRVMMWGAVHVVLPSWVFECSKQRQDVSTKDHLVSAESVLRGSAQAQGRIKEIPVPNARTCIANRDNMTPVEAVGCVQEYQHDKSGFVSVTLPGDESFNFEVSPRTVDLRAHGTGKARLEENAEMLMQPPRSRSGLVAIPATQLELVEKCKGFSNSVFSGYVFGLLDPTASQQIEVGNLIIHGGGSVERDVSLKTLHFVVFSHKTIQDAEVYHGTAEVVSDIWIRHCAKDDKLLGIRDHILYQPLRIQLPLPGFEKFVLCPSQLKDKERELMAELCILLGGKFSEDLVRQVTHLILKVPEGDKYQGALKLDTVAIVSHDWLIACASRNMVVPVDEYRVGKEVPSEKVNGVPLSVGFPQGNEILQNVAIPQSNEIPQSIAIPQSSEIPESVAIPQSSASVVECGPSMPEMLDVRVGASEGNQGTKSEIAAMGSSQMVTRDASAGIKGKKTGARFKQPQQARPRTRGAEVRLSQVQNQGHSNLDPWDSIAAPWAPVNSKPKKGKTSPESAKGSALPRPATRSQQKLQPNTEDNPLPSNDVQIDNSTTPKPIVEKDRPVVTAGGESLKDSGESEGLAAAIEGLLETTIKVSASKRKGTLKTDVEAALLSPERSRIRINQDYSGNQSEFKRAKPMWHRTRSTTGALNPSSIAQNHVTHDHFEETQMESQVAYEEDLAGRQLILEKVRTRSTTKATIRRPDRSPKDSWKERLCRIADGNR